MWSNLSNTLQGMACVAQIHLQANNCKISKERVRGKGELGKPRHKTHEVKEWRQESREGEKLLSSLDWFDELPMHAVAMPDTMILPDLEQPASYYAILTYKYTHQSPSDLQVSNSPTESLEKLSLWSKINKMFTHIQMTDALWSRFISPAVYPFYLAVLTLHYQWSMDRKISQEWRPW